MSKKQEPELTPWFTASVKPARKGVYERKFDGPPFSYWDGLRWGWSASTADKAASGMGKDFKSCFQRQPWRGLTKKA